MTAYSEELPEEELVVAKREEVILRIANTTDVHKLATSIQGNIESGRRVVLSCVGVQTVNQAVKATAIANGRTAPHGFLLMLYPTFHMERKAEGVEHTVVRFVLCRHNIGD